MEQLEIKGARAILIMNDVIIGYIKSGDDEYEPTAIIKDIEFTLSEVQDIAQILTKLK